MTTAIQGIFAVRPYTPHCQVIHDEGDHAVIGISSGNSYFTHDRVLELARWGLDHFRQVDLIWTDMHVAEMFVALGYPEAEAQRKAVKNLRGVRAKVTAAVAALDPEGERLRGRPMSALLELPAYQRIRSRLDTLMTDDPEFREVCDQLAARFLADKLNGQPPTELQREVCIKYVCAEVPLFLDTPEILGVSSSLNCYHQALPLAELLYARGWGLRASRNQGHAVITPAEEAEEQDRSA
ncbi:tRNA-dependent cyclodipeptide synthase [Streptomyces sp. NBC_00211]|uniref:tRNA-dependent cyclodipeptide synthase n=1 Tax=Streptomyces sp. NBC_00211 TaxID=2975683 RepID=UPI00325658E9